MIPRRFLLVLLGSTTGMLVVLITLWPGESPGSGGADPRPPVAGAPTDPLAPPAERAPAPNLHWRGADGPPRVLGEMRGSVVALFFGYTHCPDVCPLTLARLARVKEELTRNGRPLRVVFVSVDPERDDPTTVARYLRRFGPGLDGGPGDPGTLEAEAAAYGAAFHIGRSDPTDEANGRSAGEYLVDHTSRIFFVDADGRLAGHVAHSASTEELKRLLLTLLAEASAPAA